MGAMLFAREAHGPYLLNQNHHQVSGCAFYVGVLSSIQNQTEH